MPLEEIMNIKMTKLATVTTYLGFFLPHLTRYFQPKKEQASAAVDYHTVSVFVPNRFPNF